MTTLRIADGLSLPLDAATETFLIVGKRGSGKSSTGVRIAEQLIRRKVPVAVLDPVDVWWGLKAGADGAREGGLELYVFGGEHSDLPLEPTAGRLMAETLVEHRISAVFVLRAFSNREKARFVAEFAERLYQRNRETLHLFCEEAHELMPQSIAFKGQGEEEMLGRMLRLVKLGRTSGIGVSSITQRPASLNKNATTQAEVLIAHRLLGPQDLKAIDGWIEHHQEQAHRQEVLSTLGELRTGEAWIWAPDFPEGSPVGLKRVSILMPETYDSRRTPKPGERRTDPKSLAPVDLERLRSKMAATIERAKAEDPRELRRQVAELRAELAKAQKAQPAPSQPARVEIPILKPSEISRLEAALDRLDAIRDRAAQAQQVIVSETGLLREALNKWKTAPVRECQAVRAAPGRIAPTVNTRPSASGASLNGSAFPRGERIILTAIAQHAEGVTREQLTVLTGYRRSSRDAYLQRLKEKGLWEARGEFLVAVDGTDRILGPDFSPLPTGSALLEHWLRSLPTGEQKILDILARAYPEAVHRERLSELTNYQRSSRDAYLQRLKARRLIGVESGGLVRASRMLFDGTPR